MKNHIAREDWKYVPVDPDPNFNADRNREIIERTMKKAEKMHKKKLKESEAGIKDRASAVATYLKSLQKGGKESNINKYFGRRELARLRGEHVLKELQRAKKEKQR